MRMSIMGFVFACGGCASIQVVAPLDAGDSSCVARVFANQIEVLDSDRVVQLPEPKLWTPEGVTEDGRRIVSRRSELDLTSLTVVPVRPELPGSVVDVSADGSVVLVSIRQGTDDRRTLALFDRKTGSSHPLTPGATDGAISPDGLSIAEQLGSRIRAYSQGQLLLEVEGRFASWLDANTLAYVRKSNDYEFVDTRTGQRRLFKPVGQPLMALQRSRESGALLYASRTRSDFWSFNSRCPERYRIVVHHSETGIGLEIGFGCKATRPETVRWINAERVCSTER